jgi:hypothetical protein
MLVPYGWANLMRFGQTGDRTSGLKANTKVIASAALHRTPVGGA